MARFLFIIARGDAFGGSSRHVMDMAARLENDGHSALVLVGGEAGMEVPRRLAARGVNFRCVPSMGRAISPLKDMRAMLEIRRHVKGFAPDIISLHSSKAGVLGRLACVGCGAPVLYTPHCWAFMDGFPKAGFYRFIEKLLAPLATRIVAVSEAERDFGLRRGVGRPERTVTIHNGLGEPGGPPERSSDGDGPVRLIMVGRFEIQKDHPLLLRALSDLTDRDWTLTLVGDGPTKSSCMDLAASLGIAERVSFSGYQSDCERDLADHDVFLLVTNWEGFPRSILEAMLAGLPVIASDVGGCGESVIDGLNGRIVPKGCQSSLRWALAGLMGSARRREQMGRASRQLYAERFTFDAMYAHYRQLYQGLISRSRKAADPAPAKSLPARPSRSTSFSG